MAFKGIFLVCVLLLAVVSAQGPTGGMLTVASCYHEYFLTFVPLVFQVTALGRTTVDVGTWTDYYLITASEV